MGRNANWVLHLLIRSFCGLPDRLGRSRLVRLVWFAGMIQIASGQSLTVVPGSESGSSHGSATFSFLSNGVTMAATSGGYAGVQMSFLASSSTPPGTYATVVVTGTPGYGNMINAEGCSNNGASGCVYPNEQTIFNSYPVSWCFNGCQFMVYPNEEITFIFQIGSNPPVNLTFTVMLGSGPPPTTLTITSPANGATPQSAFVAVAGTGPAGDTLNVLLNSLLVGTVVVDSEGKWEALPFVGGTGSIQVQDTSTSTFSNIITVQTLLPSYNPSPEVPVSNSAFLPLEHADIFIAGGGTTSPQTATFGALYTHTALYLGGDSNGTPIIAEAVPNGGAFGQVRSVPLEQSTVWTEYFIVSAFHPTVPLLSTQKDAIVAWAKNITSQGLPYWNVADFGLIVGADVLFDASFGTLTPRFNAFLNAIGSFKNSTSTFICSTLVWRAYYEGTSHTLDISNPNLMTPEPGSLMAAFSSSFITQLDAVFIVPETFAVSPQLSKMF
jgi:hypothetical protein